MAFSKQATDIATVTQQSGPVLAVPGWPLMDANRIEAYATAAMATSGGIAIYGYAHRVT